MLDVVQQDGEIFLVLEYVPGEPLRERLGAPLSLHSFIEIAIECTEALAAAHHAGVVHHDIKPENFMVLPNGHVKLLDLGLATSVLASDTLGSEPAGTHPFRGKTMLCVAALAANSLPSPSFSSRPRRLHRMRRSSSTGRTPPHP